MLVLAAVAALIYASSTTDVTDFLFRKHVPPIHGPSAYMHAAAAIWSAGTPVALRYGRSELGRPTGQLVEAMHQRSTKARS